MLRAASEQLILLADELQHLCSRLGEEEDNLQLIRSVLEGFQPTAEICERIRIQQRKLDDAELGIDRAAVTLRLAAQDYMETERQIELSAATAAATLARPAVSLLNQADLSDISVG